MINTDNIQRKRFLNFAQYINKANGRNFSHVYRKLDYKDLIDTINDVL